MSDDKTRQDGGELPETDPAADSKMIDELGDRSGEDSSEDDTEGTDLRDDMDKDESGKAGKKTSKVVARKTMRAPAKRIAAARKHSKAERGEHDPCRAKNPTQFVRQSVARLRRVMWPSQGEPIVLFLAVLLFMLSIITCIALLDNGFNWTLLSLFGGNPQ